MSLIKKFEKIESADLFNLAGDSSVGKNALINTDVYRKPVPEKEKGIIDVVERFSWFAGGASSKLTKAAIAKIPKVILVEKEQVLNSQISQALYFLNASLRGVGDVGSALSKFSEYIGVDTSKGTLAGAAKDSVDEAFKKLQAGARKLSATGGDTARLEANYLRSLIGLYVTEDTKFKYAFPYFDKPPEVRNSWGAPNNEGAANAIINTGMDIVEEVSSFVNIAQPGVYIQKSKHFSSMEEGPSITVKFPLFNTVKRGSELPYQLNYELLWLLTYQNKPYKTSFARSIPPKIYDVTIPGMVNMPYAYISSLSVDFIGTVRNKQINIADLGTITAPIPDAYNVTIQITSLLSDYANLMVGKGFGVSTIGNTVTLRNPETTTPPPARSSIPGVSLVESGLNAGAPENDPRTATGGRVQGPTNNTVFTVDGSE